MPTSDGQVLLYPKDKGSVKNAIPVIVIGAMCVAVILTSLLWCWPTSQLKNTFCRFSFPSERFSSHVRSTAHNRAQSLPFKRSFSTTDTIPLQTWNANSSYAAPGNTVQPPQFPPRRPYAASRAYSRSRQSSCYSELSSYTTQDNESGLTLLRRPARAWLNRLNPVAWARSPRLGRRGSSLDRLTSFAPRDFEALPPLPFQRAEFVDEETISSWKSIRGALRTSTASMPPPPQKLKGPNIGVTTGGEALRQLLVKGREIGTPVVNPATKAYIEKKFPSTAVGASAQRQVPVVVKHTVAEEVVGPGKNEGKGFSQGFGSPEDKVDAPRPLRLELILRNKLRDAISPHRVGSGITVIPTASTTTSSCGVNRFSETTARPASWIPSPGLIPAPLQPKTYQPHPLSRGNSQRSDKSVKLSPNLAADNADVINRRGQCSDAASHERNNSFVSTLMTLNDVSYTQEDGTDTMTIVHNPPTQTHSPIRTYFPRDQLPSHEEVLPIQLQSTLPPLTSIPTPVSPHQRFTCGPSTPIRHPSSSNPSSTAYIHHNQLSTPTFHTSNPHTRRNAISARGAGRDEAWISIALGSPRDTESPALPSPPLPSHALGMGETSRTVLLPMPSPVRESLVRESLVPEALMPIARVLNALMPYSRELASVASREGWLEVPGEPTRPTFEMQRSEIQAEEGRDEERMNEERVNRFERTPSLPSHPIPRPPLHVAKSAWSGQGARVHATSEVERRGEVNAMEKVESAKEEVNQEEIQVKEEAKKGDEVESERKSKEKKKRMSEMSVFMQHPGKKIGSIRRMHR